MENIRIGIIGAAGYTGGELIRILIHHPFAEIAYACSGSQAGKHVFQTHLDLVGDTELLFSKDFHFDVDVIFLCAGHGEAMKFLNENDVPDHIKIIDLSHDFRLGESVKGKEFVYGLPEIHKEQIQSAQNIANPGCFATAIQLGLLPILASGQAVEEIHTTGITGSTGAGQSLSETSHFSRRLSNLSVYKVFQHQHLKEINKTFGDITLNQKPEVHFVPYRGPFSRGIWITSYLKSDMSVNDAFQMYQDFYQTHPFTHVSESALDLKQVVNTNKCLVNIEKQGNHLLFYSIIDNLIKGASGQAVQNMNLMFGLDETTGLQLKSTAF
jgi:N-acetyl-gamma-glutamyl-phosphate reductase